jgi:hypothetical protein
MQRRGPETRPPRRKHLDVAAALQRRLLDLRDRVELPARRWEDRPFAGAFPEPTPGIEPRTLHYEACARAGRCGSDVGMCKQDGIINHLAGRWRIAEAP